MGKHSLLILLDDRDRELIERLKAKLPANSRRLLCTSSINAASDFIAKTRVTIAVIGVALSCEFTLPEGVKLVQETPERALNDDSFGCGVVRLLDFRHRQARIQGSETDPPLIYRCGNSQPHPEYVREGVIQPEDLEEFLSARFVMHKEVAA